MTYTAKLRRLERLLRVDYRAYLDELDKPWLGMEDDLAMAITILRKHAARSGGRLPLLERYNVPDDPSETATVTLRRGGLRSSPPSAIYMSRPKPSTGFRRYSMN